MKTKENIKKLIEQAIRYHVMFRTINREEMIKYIEWDIESDTILKNDDLVEFEKYILDLFKNKDNTTEDLFTTLLYAKEYYFKCYDVLAGEKYDLHEEKEYLKFVIKRYKKEPNSYRKISISYQLKLVDFLKELENGIR